MIDGQGPTYQVFKQDRPGGRHENVGTVHAADAEMALLHARDVFVRRPDCASLWVAPEASITSRTAQEMTGQPAAQTEPGGSAHAYLAFHKVAQRGTHVYAGRVMAGDPQQALARAAAEFPDPPALVWWVLPENALASSDPGEADSMFGPAEEKLYRDQAFYRTDSLMREIEVRKAKSADRR
jgi:ring-1,2-phenylacetyl-CoA epoxidase subunit PaaB